MDLVAALPLLGDYRQTCIHLFQRLFHPLIIKVKMGPILLQDTVTKMAFFRQMNQERINFVRDRMLSWQLKMSWTTWTNNSRQ